MFTTVFIDIDNTLLDFDKCAKDSIKRACDFFSLAYPKNLFAEFIKTNDMLWGMIEKGTLTREELHKIRFELVFKSAGVNFDGQTFEKKFREYLRESHEKVDGADELLFYLSKKYRIYAVSNAAHKEQATRLEKAGLYKYFSGVFVSDEIGAQKPNKEFFDECFKRIPNCKISETVMIGDSLSADISGGKEYGLFTVWFNFKNTGAKSTADVTVNRLTDIKKYL